MNKKYLVGFLFTIIAITFVTASLLVSSFVITADISEPFTVEYAIISDDITCTEYVGEWIDGVNINVDSFFPGETKLVCTSITNIGTGDIDYTLSSNVTSIEDVEACEDALGAQIVIGTANGSTNTIDNLEIVIPDNTPVIENCKLTVSIVRG